MERAEAAHPARWDVSRLGPASQRRGPRWFDAAPRMA